MLTLAAGGAIVLVAGGLGIKLATDARGKSSAEEAEKLAQDAYAALRDGATGRAVELARRARSEDPVSERVRTAWIHAEGLDLLEGAGDADAMRAVGLMSEVHRLGVRGPVFAFTALAVAVAMKNDRYARRLLDEQTERGVTTDAFWEYAAGAVYDLDCDPANAEEHFEASASAWADALLPRLRRARSLAFDARLDEARDELEGTLPTAVTAAARVIVERLEEPAFAAAPEPAAVQGLPRSFRVLGEMLATIDAGEADPALVASQAKKVDSPLVAVAFARVAAGSRQLAIADEAATVARASRPDLRTANTLHVEIALARGDLDAATKIAEATGDTELISLTAAILAYEEGDAQRLRALHDEADATGLPEWPLYAAALGNLGAAERPAIEPLSLAVDDNVPWADLMLVDASVALGRWAEAEAIVATWAEDSVARARRRRKVVDRRGSP